MDFYLIVAISSCLIGPFVMSWILPRLSKQWSAERLHCYVTGGSQGLGLSLALLLTKEGADVSIVARNEERLKSGLQSMEAVRVSNDQKLNAYSYDLTTSEGAKSALEAVCSPYDGRAPDAVFLCAGAALPKFFVEASESDFKSQVETIYYTALWTSWAVTKQMVRQNVKGKITFVSSTLGYMSVVGYSLYAPMKHALRGLADTLRSENLFYGIDVHIFFPGSMDTPGLQTENATKPKMTMKIEEADSVLSPDKAAAILLRSVKSGRVHIAGNLITDMFRASTRGATPYHNVIYDAFLATIAWIAVPVWRWGVDADVRKHSAEHEQYLRQKGFFSVSA